MNARLLRHYQQSSIPKPTMEGKFAKYSQEHIDAAVALRQAQDFGVSSKAYAVISGMDSHSTPEKWLAESMAQASSLRQVSPMNIPNDTTTNESVSKKAALEALRNLGGPSLKSPAETMKFGSVSANTPLSNGSISVNAATNPIVHEMTECLLSHNSRLQIPASIYQGMNDLQRKELRDWIANMPTLTSSI